jgi:hypothetical protein
MKEVCNNLNLNYRLHYTLKIVILQIRSKNQQALTVLPWMIVFL